MSSDHEMPVNPISPNAEAMIQLHEIYREMRRAGFSMLEATRIIGIMLGTQGPS